MRLEQRLERLGRYAVARAVSTGRFLERLSSPLVAGLLAQLVIAVELLRIQIIVCLVPRLVIARELLKVYGVRERQRRWSSRLPSLSSWRTARSTEPLIADRLRKSVEASPRVRGS